MKPSSAPLVSVVLPVRECRHLSEALPSILMQTFTRIEVLVILHKTRPVCRRAAESLGQKDSRVRFLTLEAGSLSDALNFGIGESTTPLVARMDADDVAHPERIAAQYERFSRGDIDVCGTNGLQIDDAGAAFGDIIYPETDVEIRRVLGLRNPLAHPSAMFSREAYNLSDGYRSELRLAQDYDLWIRMAEQGLCFHNIQRPLLHYRSPQSNLSQVDGLWMKFNVLASAASRRYLDRDLFEENPNLWSKFSVGVLREFSADLSPFCDEVEERLRDVATYADFQKAVSLAISALPILEFARTRPAF